MKSAGQVQARKLAIAIAAASALVSFQSRGQVLEEVVVVAQKRVESVQEVPLSVSVIDGEALELFSINNATDLARSVPGLTIMPAPQGLSLPKIRGLGTGTGDENMDQSVGLFIDGVWTGKARDLQSALYDLDRIEVIKGTQTSQLGKNTSLGAILVMSRRPEDDSGGYVQADYDFELGSSILAGAGNLATGFGNYRLAVNLVDEEGFVDNQLVGGDDPAREQYSARLGGSWELGDRGAIYASYSYDDREVTGMSFEVAADPLGWYTGITGDTDVSLNNKRKTWTSYGSNGRDFDDQESHRALLELSYDIGDAMQFVSLSGYNEYDNTRYYDADFSAATWLEQYKESSFKQFSQEFRISSTAFNDRLDYVAGVFYLDNNFENYSETGFLTNLDYIPTPEEGVYAATGPALGVGEYEQDVESWSVFGNGAIQLADRWRLTLGIRYTDESRELLWQASYLEDETYLYLGNPATGPAVQLPVTFLPLASPEFPATKLERDEDNVDGSINLQYDFSDAGNLYASWARGSKSGGFTTANVAPENSEFDTEVAETTELGVKSELLGGGLRLNAALFYTEIEDFQSVEFVGTGFATDTIPVESQGFEFDSMWAATENLVLALSATYAEVENTETGTTPAGSPEWSASLTLDHSLGLGSNFLLRTNAAVNYRDDIYTQDAETYEAPAITLVDLRVALAPLSERWELALMARNLFDEQELSFGFDMPFFGGVYGTANGSYNRPRTLSLQARYNF
jgi:iron complex outermembrane receptor protein